MSNGKEKIISPLRKAMSELDYGLPEDIFNHEEGHRINDLIQKVWEEIDKLEYNDWDTLAEQGHSPKMIESILASKESEDE